MYTGTLLFRPCGSKGGRGLTGRGGGVGFRRLSVAGRQSLRRGVDALTHLRTHTHFCMIERDDRLGRQLRFIAEVDALKRVLRQTLVGDASRRENSAEHSWHLALMASLLAEWAPEGVDVARAMRIALVHDLVEIDAGDAFCYDADANVGKEERERRAAERVFGLLPADQGEELRGLWEEFEAGRTPEARYANALDRLQPLLQNLYTDGGTWRMHGVERERVRARMEPIRGAMPEVWPFVEWMLEHSAAKGWVS